MQREGLLKKPAHRPQSGHDEKRYLPPSQRRERPFVSFALIANQASNIFFGPFLQSPKLFLTIKKRPPKTQPLNGFASSTTSQVISLLASYDLDRRILSGSIKALSQLDRSLPPTGIFCCLVSSARRGRRTSLTLRLFSSIFSERLFRTRRTSASAFSASAMPSAAI